MIPPADNIRTMSNFCRKLNAGNCVPRAMLLGTLCIALGIVLANSKFASAKIGFRQLTSVHPVAVQRGTESLVRVRSNFTLDNTYGTYFNRPGISMTYAETEPIEAPRKGRASVGTPFRFNVTVPDGQPTGVYDFRVATRQAVSSISHLLVTDYPVVVETKESNDTPDAAQTVSMPAAICGVCEKAEDVDCFRFSGVQGQLVSMQVYTQRVTERIHIMLVRQPVYHMDSILTLIGPSGQVVGENDNYFGADSLLQCELPETGEYVLKIRDTRYAGSEKHSYCIEVSDRPFLRGLFPLAIQRGTESEAELFGFGLQAAPRLSLRAEKEDALGWTAVRAIEQGVETNETPLLISDDPQITVGQGSGSIESATSITLPCGVNGRLSEPDSKQYFAFEARKGVYYRFEITAHRQGLPLDSILELYDSNGKKLDEEDDVRFSPYATRWYQKDSRMDFKAPADGTYYVAVCDLNGRGGEEFVYHLQAELSGPEFEVYGDHYYAMLAPGTRMIWHAKIKRMNGFSGPVEIGVEGLPAGVTLTPVTIPAGMDHCAMILSASEDARVDAALVRTFGKATITRADGSVEEIMRYGDITCELQSGSGSSQTRWPCDTQLVGVTEPLDLAEVEASPDEVDLPAGGKAEIKVRITRTEGNSDPVTLAMSHMYQTRSSGDQLPPGVTLSSDSRTQLSGDQTEATIILEASKDALPVERFPIAVMTRVYITYSISTNYASTPIYLTVKQTQ